MTAQNHLTGIDAMHARVLVIELEPTHYKTDLWNAVVDTGEIEVRVIYTERHNWSRDGGHDYQRFPADRYEAEVLSGRGFAGALHSTAKVLGACHKLAPELIYIAGYVHFQTVAAILYATLFGKRFVVHGDVFNNSMPEGRLRLLKWAMRQSLRRLIFARADSVLVCGKQGMATGLEAGCPKHKLVDFPYSVSLARIQADTPIDIPKSCLEDLQVGGAIVFFSGRMIPRKGLSTLLEAMARLETNMDWVLWIEGAGPDLEVHEKHAYRLGISERCRFLGFCQYDLHSWLIRSAEIVVVPSLKDSWGVVVDEGLQLGKAVISSDATGSGQDRIESGANGFIFPAGNDIVLAEILQTLLNQPDLKVRIGRAAAAGHRNIRPEDNAANLVKVVDRKR